MMERDAPENYPPDRAAWHAAGFTAAQAHGWHRWRIEPQEALAWCGVGVHDGLEAAQWSVAGAKPGTVGRWIAAGVAPAEAVQWHEIGFRFDAIVEFRRQGITPDQALVQRHGQDPMAAAMSRFRSAGVRGEIVHGYLFARWIDEEAVRWAGHQIAAHDARLWKVLGLTPAEAVRLTRQQRSPDDLIRQWWQAGIPFEEVGDWLGAGLSAEEASVQRAQGVTAEQAAALRALREGDDDPSPA